MKALIISHMFPRKEGDWGGIFVLEQVKALRARGVDARVIFGDALWHPFKVLVERVAQFRIASVKSSRWRSISEIPVASFSFDACVEPWWGRLAPVSYTLGALMLTRALANSFIPDVIHAHTSLLDGTAANVISKWFKKPYLITEHTGPFSVITRNPAARWFVKRAAIGAKYFVSVSSTLQNDVYTQLGLSDSMLRNIIIPNGFDRQVFYSSVMPSMSATLKVLWVGAFQEIKQPILALESFAQARVQNPRLALTMVGEGELESSIRTTIERLQLAEYVTVMPILPRKELAELIRSHHCLLVTSKSETFCLVALEALACGRPVLTTACGGPVDLVGGTARGRIVAANRDEIKDALLALTGSLQRYDSVGISQFALAGFSYESVAERVSTLYEQAINA
jgi:glycosyltransferase involved in cell wall biosynthesis